jgi:chromosome partitioning protein
LGLGRDATPTVYDALVGDQPLSIEAVARPAGPPNLDIAPATPDLAGAEVELVGMAWRERRLSNALVAARDAYAVTLLDCPPSLGLLSVNALVAADGVLVPVQCEYLSLEGLGLLVNTLDLIRSHLNPKLQLAGVVLTMFDGRTRLSSEVVEEVGRHFPGLRFGTVIPRSVRLSEAPSFGVPIESYAPDSTGAAAYRSLAEELAGRFNLEPGREVVPAGVPA